MGNLTNLIKGGEGDYAIPENVDPTELALGIQIEMEHTNDERIAKEIALDHLSENPHYYNELVKAGLASEYTTRPNSGYGDPNAPFNDDARIGDDNDQYTQHTNMGGKIGNTSNGQVSGRRSNPIHNKTINIELDEKSECEAFDPTISTSSHDSGTYNSGNDFIGIAEMKMSKIKEYIRKMATEEKMKEIAFIHQTPNSPLKHLSLDQKGKYDDVVNIVRKKMPEYFKETVDALDTILSLGPDNLKSSSLEYVNRFVNNVLRNENDEDFIKFVLELAYKIYGIDKSTLKENMKKTKLSLKDQLRNLISEEMENLNGLLEQNNDDLEVDAEDNQVTITLDKGLAQAIYDALTDVLEIEDEEADEEEIDSESPDASSASEPEQAPEQAPEAPTQQSAPTTPTAPETAAEPATEPESDVSASSDEDVPEKESPAVKEAKKWVYESKIKNKLASHNITIDKLQSATKKGGKLGQRTRLTSTLKKIK